MENIFMGLVLFHYADIKKVSLRYKKEVKKQIADIFVMEGARELRRLDYIFCSDSYLLEINTAFLNHDTYTDIITFDLSEGVGIVGEVYVSVDRVKENARLELVTFESELLRVLFHGALHLCGFN